MSPHRPETTVSAPGVERLPGQAKSLDVITIGRSSVDLYGAQVGGHLEDMRTFDKYIGGSPTNMAAGTARLGLKSALITRVGDEHMGRFIREQLVREGVDVRGVKTDPERLTALVLLGIRDQNRFPLIFYRENCADMALCEDDMDPGFIAQARSVVVTGTHLSHPRTQAAILKALDLAREQGARTALDIDYRPNLWGLAGHGQGESRFIESQAVTARLQATLHRFDLIVGTEEEFHIAGGSTDTLTALRAVRDVSKATLVCKRGPMGATAFVGDIPDSLDQGLAGPGFPIEVFNVLGAGDGFMSGLLKGWLDDETWPLALTYANACGALAVSRHGCAPAYPSWQELQFFLARGVQVPALRFDTELEQVHWATNRTGAWPELRVFAFDHRLQLEQMPAADAHKIGQFKQLCLQAAVQVANGQPGFGVLCDGRLGQAALFEATGQGLWIGRPVEVPGSRPLQLEPELGPELGALAEWPAGQVVKVLCFCHPDDEEALWAQQIASLQTLFAATRRHRLEFLLEVIPSKVASVTAATLPAIVNRVFDAGINPDWWKLEALDSEPAWAGVCQAIQERDPYTRGIVVLGLDAPAEQLFDRFALAARYPLVKGFAVGRTIFGDVARAWMQGQIDDADAVQRMAGNYQALCQTWDRARSEHKAPEPSSDQTTP